ncbi:M23 family metallopeptidase [Streptomyces caniscabiei]|uniref:M23 family metallopeptidase n=1 Tax=Streptomyces caniscabiei TaxID=2746961 RepID=UPI0029BD3995|nr:M23 family metallopeptidase [Streptomyces caniscabiei]MDX3728650.1 M23 family metallopeptidase [Streptomyces caniscabiei]
MPFKCNTHWRIDTWGHNPALDMVVKGNTKDSATKYVKVGQTVGAKKQIGRVGATGKNSGDHAHLHYEQRYRTNGIPTEKHRKPVHFNGKSYTGKSKTWKDVVSKNC